MRKGQLELRKPFPRASANRVEAAQPEYRVGGKAWRTVCNSRAVVIKTDR